MNKAESIKRLRRLQKELRAVAADKKRLAGFHMGTWYEAAIDQAPEVTLNVDPATGKCTFETDGEGICDTRACALGHAAMIPAFRTLGLRLNFSDSASASAPSIHADEGHISAEVKYRNSVNSLDAGRMFFGVTLDQATRMFGGIVEDNNNPLEVVDLIDGVIEELRA